MISEKYSSEISGNINPMIFDLPFTKLRDYIRVIVELLCDFKHKL